MALYDIHGKVISSGGSGGTSEHFVEKTVNMLNPADFTYGKQWANNSWWNPSEKYFYVDVPVEYGKTYYCNLTEKPCATKGTTEYLANGAVNFDGLNADGVFVSGGISANQSVAGFDSQGARILNNYTIISVTSEQVKTVRIYGLIEYSLTVHGSYNGMFSDEYTAPNFNAYGIEYLGYAYGNNLYELDSNAYLALMEKMEDDDRATEMLDYKGLKPNPIYGKKVWIVGDSNTQYALTIIEPLFVDEYGCEFTSYAKAGHAWGTTDSANGFNTTDNSGIGQLNRICAQAEYANDGEYFAEDKHIFLFMMGTNSSSGGSGNADTNDPSTAYSAMEYCFRKISRYARVGNAVGVIIPLEINQTDKENQIALCKKYAIPYIDLMTEVRVYQDNGTNYLTDGGNHMAANGVKHWKRIIGKWVAYQI